MSPLWLLAHIKGRSCGATGTLKIRPTTTPFSSTSKSSWFRAAMTELILKAHRSAAMLVLCPKNF
jgi:hypothetical protein